MWFRLSRIAPGTVITAIIVIIMAGRLARHHPLRRQSPLSVKRLMWLLGGEIRTTGRPVVIIRPFPHPLVAIAHWHLHRLPVRPLPRPSVPLIPTDLFRLDSWHHSFFLDRPSKKEYIFCCFSCFLPHLWTNHQNSFSLFMFSMDRRIWTFPRTLRGTLHPSPEVGSTATPILWVKWSVRFPVTNKQLPDEMRLSMRMGTHLEWREGNEAIQIAHRTLSLLLAM